MSRTHRRLGALATLEKVAHVCPHFLDGLQELHKDLTTGQQFVNCLSWYLPGVCNYWQPGCAKLEGTPKSRNFYSIVVFLIFL
jgi:hypothetical protein